jgi:hypothetical protein
LPNFTKKSLLDLDEKVEKLLEKYEVQLVRATVKLMVCYSGEQILDDNIEVEYREIAVNQEPGKVV